MTKGKLIVIGGDAAGMTAASKVRREQPEREIIVLDPVQIAGKSLR